MTSNREIVAQERQESQDVDSSLAQKKQPRRLRYRSLLWCGAGLTLILFIAWHTCMDGSSLLPMSITNMSRLIPLA